MMNSSSTDYYYQQGQKRRVSEHANPWQGAAAVGENELLVDQTRGEKGETATPAHFPEDGLLASSLHSNPIFILLSSFKLFFISRLPDRKPCKGH